MNKETLEHLKRWEGLRLTAYPDPGSRDGEPWTIGYGHTSDGFMKVYRGLTITEDQAEAALAHDAQEAADAISRLVVVPLNENQMGALVSFVFNVGIGAFKKSSLLRKLNSGDYASVPAELARWNKNDGKVMKGLTNRRLDEGRLWNKSATRVVAEIPAATGSKPPPAMQPPALGPSWLERLIAGLVAMFGKGKA
jgi:lysozyme